MTTITTTIRQIPDEEKSKFFLMLHAMNKMSEKDYPGCAMFRIQDLEDSNRSQVDWVDDTFGWHTTTIGEIVE